LRQVSALLTIPKAANLLKFLEENRIRDRKALKTFYEMASISAGELPIQGPVP
jgi:hypothetical protein